MRRTAQLLAAIALLGGCRGEQTPTETLAQLPPEAAASQGVLATAQNNELATLMRATAPFQDFATAAAAGWSTEITPCMSGPEGAMGFHYGNVGLIDGVVRVDAPELLLYEPDASGQLHLVAVEYIIPYTARSRSATPPVLFGRQFSRNDTFQLWGLHVWAWKPNPRGLFAPWNKQVTCAFARTASTMVHNSTPD